MTISIKVTHTILKTRKEMKKLKKIRNKSSNAKICSLFLQVNANLKTLTKFESKSVSLQASLFEQRLSVKSQCKTLFKPFAKTLPFFNYKSVISSLLERFKHTKSICKAIWMPRSIFWEKNCPPSL